MEVLGFTTMSDTLHRIKTARISEDFDFSLCAFNLGEHPSKNTYILPGQLAVRESRESEFPPTEEPTDSDQSQPDIDPPNLYAIIEKKGG